MSSKIGLGCMSMGAGSWYGKNSDDEAIRTIHEAIDRGVTLLDTGDFYGMGANEMLVGRALKGGGRREKVKLSVKFGGLRDPAGGFLGVDLRPSAIKNFLAYSLKRLDVEVIDIYRPARLDPAVPIEESIGAIKECIDKGWVKEVSLSEVGADTIRRAHAVHPIRDLQIEYSIASRGPEEKIFPVLHELGIGATLYGVLSRGLLAGSKPTGADFRAYLPRFSGDAAKENEAVVEKLHAFAKRLGRTPAQVCVGWALTKEPGFMPLVGARKPEHLDILDAKPLTADEMGELERVLPKDAIKGTRYPAQMMAHLDSEK